MLFSLVYSGGCLLKEEQVTKQQTSETAGLSVVEAGHTGKTLTVAAKHAGHVVTVGPRDIEKHKAYWIHCECGEKTLIGEYWLERALERGTLAHGAIARRGENEA